MTIAKARMLLGDAGKALSDQEVESLLAQFEALIEIGFQQFEAKLSLGKQKKMSNNRTL